MKTNFHFKINEKDEAKLVPDKTISNKTTNRKQFFTGFDIAVNFFPSYYIGDGVQGLFIDF